MCAQQEQAASDHERRQSRRLSRMVLASPTLDTSSHLSTQNAVRAARAAARERAREEREERAQRSVLAKIMERVEGSEVRGAPSPLHRDAR